MQSKANTEFPAQSIYCDPFSSLIQNALDFEPLQSCDASTLLKPRASHQFSFSRGSLNLLAKLLPVRAALLCLTLPRDVMDQSACSGLCSECLSSCFTSCSQQSALLPQAKLYLSLFSFSLAFIPARQTLVPQRPVSLHWVSQSDQLAYLYPTSLQKWKIWYYDF